MGTDCVSEPNCWKPPGTLRYSWTSTVSAYRLLLRLTTMRRVWPELAAFGVANRVIATSCVRTCTAWAAGAGLPVAKRPRLRRETDATGVERLVEKLDDVEDRRVEREEKEVRDRWWWDFKPEPQGARLAEQPAHLEVVGRELLF